MADPSPKVKRSLARYLAALVARLEVERGQSSEGNREAFEDAFEASLLALSDDELGELENLAGLLAAGLAVGSVAARA